MVETAEYLQGTKLKWTRKIDKFIVDDHFSEIIQHEGMPSFRLNKSFKENFLFLEEMNIPKGELYRYDFGETDIELEVIKHLIKNRHNYQIPLCHGWKIIREQCFNPEGKFWLREGGKSVFLFSNVWDFILPTYTHYKESETQIKSYSEEERLQPHPLKGKAAKSAFEHINAHKDTLFFFRAE